MLEIFSPSSSGEGGEREGERGGNPPQQRSSSKMMSSWTVRRAIEVSRRRALGGDEETTSKEEEEEEEEDDDDAWERTKNALVDARATTAIGEMLFSSSPSSPKSSASRQKSVARLCREETRTRERKSDDETKKEWPTHQKTRA